MSEVSTGQVSAEHIEILNDPQTGLKGVIVVHSTARGPAAGGCRLWRYEDETSAHRDAIRLAEGMAYKNAMADLPLGGGKAVLMVPSAAFDRAELFRAFGRAVKRLNGTYITAEDVGTTVKDMEYVAERTSYVAGLRQKSGRPGGNPSPWTALGVFHAMEAAANVRLGKALSDCVIAIQGCGNVGSALAVMLHEAGAKLFLSDTNTHAAFQVSKLTGGSMILDGNHILQIKSDIFAPCALGGILNEETIPVLGAKVVCGAANNQLAHFSDSEELHHRGILYAPDYVVNAGGIINVAGEYLQWAQAEVADRVEQIGARLTKLVLEADALKIPPAQVANQLARSAMSARSEKLRAAA